MLHAVISVTEAGLERRTSKENNQERWPTPANEEIEARVEITTLFLGRTWKIE